MENAHVLGGLPRKRAEVAAELDEAQSRVRGLMVDIDASDNTIRMFSAAVDLAEIKPKILPRRHAAYHGEVQRAIYAAFRETAGTLTTHDVTLRVMASRGPNVSDVMLVRTMQKRVGAALRQMREKGRVGVERLPAGRAGGG